MVILLPLTPVLIGILCVVLGLSGQATEYIDDFIRYFWIIVILMAIVMVICHLLRRVSVMEKVIGAVLSVASTIITAILSVRFFDYLSKYQGTHDILELLGFIATVLFIGLPWLICICGCAWASYLTVIDKDGSGYIGSALVNIGSLLLGLLVTS